MFEQFSLFFFWKSHICVFRRLFCCVHACAVDRLELLFLHDLKENFWLIKINRMISTPCNPPSKFTAYFGQMGPLEIIRAVGCMYTREWYLASGGKYFTT